VREQVTVLVDRAALDRRAMRCNAVVRVLQNIKSAFKGTRASSCSVVRELNKLRPFAASTMDRRTKD
jgi:hypothetical protein